MSSKKPDTLHERFIVRDIPMAILAARPRALFGYMHYYALAQFGEFLEREPQLSDLTQDQYALFRPWMLERFAKHQWWRASAGLRSLSKMATSLRLVASVCPRFVGKLKDKRSPGAPGTLSHFYLTRYEKTRLVGRSQRTRELYWFTVKNFSMYLEREALLADLTDENLMGVQDWMLEKGAARHSARKEFWQLAAMWRFANRKRLLETWPTECYAVTVPERVPVAWTRAELDTLWGALASIPGEIAGIPANRYWLALHNVLWITGERISAVLQLTWPNVDLKGGYVLVSAEDRKGRGSDKHSRLSAAAIESLDSIREPRRKLVFPWPYATDYLWDRYRKILEKAGLPTDRKSKFHRIRKSAASHYEAAGGNATALLGHSNRKVTLAYLDPRIVKPPQAADLLFTPGECDLTQTKGGAA